MSKSPTTSSEQSNKISNTEREIVTNDAVPLSIVVDILPCKGENAPTSTTEREKISDKMKTLENENDIIEMMDDDKSICSAVRYFCRICHDSGDEPLVSPCLCAGSAQWVHATCLITWLKESTRDTCELCQCQIMIEKKAKRVSEWQLPQKKASSFVWCIVFLCGLVLNAVAIIFHCTEDCYTVFCVIFYIFNALGIVTNVLLLVAWFPSCMLYCTRWFALNQEWVLATEISSQSGDDEADKIEL